MQNNRPPQPGGGQTFGRTAPSQPAARQGFTPRPDVRVESGPGNRQIAHGPNGSQVHMDHGRVTEVHTANGVIVRHAPDGVRHVEMARPGGRVVVVEGRGGYVQKTVIINNRPLVQRTYVVNGIVVTRAYRPFTYRPGLVLQIYTPVRYYRPGFYVYAYTPWARPVVYSSWGFVGTPWFGFYGGYFTPAPVYAAPSYWLADYMMSNALEQAYQDGLNAGRAQQQASFSGPGITPEVRQAISEEVSRQLREEQMAAQSAGAVANSDPFSGGSTHIFVAHTSVEAVAGDQICAITQGDVLEMRGTPPPDAAAANVLVRASKGGCRTGWTVQVKLQDLAEMQNHMRETIDQGMGDLQRRQGQGGLPAMTGEAAAAPAPVSWASQVQPDAGVQSELSQASEEAARAEQDALNGAGASVEPEPRPVTKTVGIGSTIDDVVAVFGQPLRSADLGSKKIYIYKDVKVTFVDGKVTDVQ
jgi:hypothetical protein